MKNLTKKYDVVILGGGTSGCSAAYNCAKLNLKTLLVEKNNYLGGLMTGGLVVPVMNSSDNKLNCDFYKKLVSKAKKYNAQITYSDKNEGWFNPEILKIVLEDILTSNTVSKNLDILFETTLENVDYTSSKIKSVNLKSGFLSIPVVAKYFIDCTATGILAKKANCKFLDDNKETQQNSLRFILGNVDIEKFVRFISKIDNDKNITNTYRNEIDTNNKIHFTTASTWDTNKIWNVDKLLKEGVKKGLLKNTDRSYFQIFSVAGGDNQVAFNCPRINCIKDNPFESSIELIKAKKAIWRLYNFAKTEFKGFENAIITNIAPITGIREENRVKTKYIYKKDDIINSKKFKTTVLRANYPIDIHSSKKNKSTLKTVATYELPIESLISADYDNLFVAGKLVGAEFSAHSALRVQKSCMSMAEGVAKYIAKCYLS